MAADGGSTGFKPDSPTAEPTTDNRPTAGRGGMPCARLRRRRRLRWALYLLAPIALAIGWGLYARDSRWVTTDDAYVEADTVMLSTDVAGSVEQIAVHDNQRVAAGQVLFRLDARPYRLKLAQAQAELGTVRDNLDAQKQNYLSLAAQIAQAEANLAFAAREFHRQSALAARGFASRQALDQARRNLETAQDQLNALEHQQAQIAAQLGGRPDLPIVQQPQYRAALAQRDEAARELRDTVVRAPFAGIVTNVPSLQPGMYLAAGTRGLAVVATQHAWVEAQPKETKLTYVRPGQQATVTVDAYPHRVGRGRVVSIAPASQSQFSLLPAENTSGNWVKVVQRIPMRVEIDTGGGDCRRCAPG